MVIVVITRYLIKLPGNFIRLPKHKCAPNRGTPMLDQTSTHLFKCDMVVVYYLPRFGRDTDWSFFRAHNLCNINGDHFDYHFELIYDKPIGGRVIIFTILLDNGYTIVSLPPPPLKQPKSRVYVVPPL